MLPIIPSAALSLELLGLVVLFAFQNMSSKFNAALDVPPQGFCRLPPRPATEENGQERRYRGLSREGRHAS
jgi:hypothetical protein